MATEASAAEQTTDAQVEEKNVADDTKTLEGENVCKDKETGGICESEEPKVEQKVSPENIATDTKETVEDEKDEAHTAAEVKKEHEDDKASASGVLEDKVDTPVVGDVKEENEDANVFGSQDSMNSKEDAYVVEKVKDKAETGEFSRSDIPEVENSKVDSKEKENTSQPLSEAAENQVVEPEISSILDSEQVGQQSEVSEPVTEIAKATEPSDVTADPALASETVEAAEPASDATGGLEKKDEIHEVNKVLEALKDEKVLNNVAEIPSEVSKEEPEVKESGNTSASQSADVVYISDKTKEANDDNWAGGYEEETANEGSRLSTTESLAKKLTVDPSLFKTSNVEGEAEASDTKFVTEISENTVKHEIKIEPQKEATLKTEPVEGQKEEKTVETEAAEVRKSEKTVETVSVEEKNEENIVKIETFEELKEEKTLEANSTLSVTDESGDLSNHTDEIANMYTKEEKISEGADKVAEELRNFVSSDSTIKATEIASDSKEKTSGVSEEPKGESITDNASLAHTSRNIDLNEQKDEAETPIKEPVDEPEKIDTIPTGDVEKDKTEEKKDGAEETDIQRLVESPKNSTKLDVEAQKLETPAKPKTLISKLKRSIVKVKKALIGKSPTSRTISVESKDASEVR